MHKRRKLESAEERKGRIEREAQRKVEQAAEDEAMLDEKVRRNIEIYGP